MRLRAVLFAAAACVAAAMLTTSVMRELAGQARKKQLIREKTAACAAAAEQLSRMRQKAEFLKTDEGKAWIAHDQLNMVFPGEEIYRIVPDKDQQRRK